MEQPDLSVVKHLLEAFDHGVAGARLEKTVGVLAESGLEVGDIVVTAFHALEMSPMIV